VVWSILLITCVIVIIDIRPLVKEKNKDWKTIFVLTGLLSLGLILSFIIGYDLLEIPSIAKVITTFFKKFLPSFFDFMQT